MPRSDSSFHRTLRDEAAQCRLCQTCAPGMARYFVGESPMARLCGAEGEEKGKGVAARRGLSVRPIRSCGAMNKNRIRDPYVRWCGREGPRGFFLSRLGIIFLVSWNNGVWNLKSIRQRPRKTSKNTKSAPKKQLPCSVIPWRTPLPIPTIRLVKNVGSCLAGRA